MATSLDPNAPSIVAATPPASPGIIGGALTPTNATVPTAPNTVATYTPTAIADPTKWTTTPDQTVAGQMTKLTADNNPLVQEAVTGAKQQMNERGLLNSSISTTAGQAAAYQAALPIATADATTAGKQASYNADTQNQINTANAAATNQGGMFNVDEATKVQLQNLQTQNQVLLNTNSQASSIFNTAVGALNNIATSTTMDAATKSAQSAQVYANLQQQLKVIGATSGLDLAGILGNNPYTDQAASDAAKAQAAKLSASSQSQPTDGRFLP